MKAVLVVDIPDDIAVEELTAYVEMYSTIPAHYKELHCDSVRVRQLPEKVIIDEDLSYHRAGNLKVIRNEIWALGFNECLDEILGGEEDTLHMPPADGSTIKVGEIE